MSEGKIGKKIEKLFGKRDKETKRLKVDKRAIPVLKLLRKHFGIEKIYRWKKYPFKGYKIEGYIKMDLSGKTENGEIVLIDIKAKHELHREDIAKLKKDVYIVENTTGNKTFGVFLVITNVQNEDDLKTVKELHGYIQILGESEKIHF